MLSSFLQVYKFQFDLQPGSLAVQVADEHQVRLGYIAVSAEWGQLSWSL